MTMEKPTKIWWNGSVTSWEDAQVHITAETSMRGINVFEGVMAYKSPGSYEHAVIELDRHIARLARSASLLHMPMPFTREQLKQGVIDLIQAEPSESDLYIRPTVFLVSGAYTDDAANMSVGASITAYTIQRRPLRSVRLRTSEFVRPDLPVFPAQAKSGAVYSALRLARISAQRHGADEPLLLNQAGAVAESAGAAILARFGDEVVSPRPEDGALDSITRGLLSSIVESETALRFSLREIHPAELREASEMVLCGTLDEVVSVASLDGHAFQDDSLARTLFESYRSFCTNLDDPRSVKSQTRVPWRAPAREGFAS